MFEKAQIPNFMKIRPVGSKLLHADEMTDGKTDMMKLTVAFRNFVNAPKSSSNITMLMGEICSNGHVYE
jgi:hypothetical protein